MQSVGIKSPFLRNITSPTWIFAHVISIFFPFSSIFIHLSAFISWSFLCLAKSSIPSLIIATSSIKTKGNTADIGFKGDIAGILYTMAVIKKYTFAVLRN